MDRIEKLERLVGQLTLENELFKKALRHTLEQSEKRENSLANISAVSKVSKEGGELMNLSRSSFYYASKKPLLSEQERDRIIGRRIETLCLKFPRYR